MHAYEIDMAKILRIWLLVLLAVLLPLRGAVAAAMLCSPSAASTSQAQTTVSHHEGHHGDPTQAADATPASAEHVHAHNHDPGSNHAQKCNLCASFCSMTLIPTACTNLIGLPEPASARYPELAAKTPSFLLEGQERPPRTI